MKFCKLSLALSGVLAAGNAFALAPNAIDPENPGVNDIVIHYAGATAQSQTVKDLATDLCVAGTIDHYNNVAADPTHLVVSCQLTTPISGKSNLYFSYYLNGGSVYGVTPVADQIPLNYMKVNGGTCSTPDNVDATHPNGNSPSLNWTCGNSGADQYPHAPEAGGSDVEPALFKNSNVAGLAFGAPMNISSLIIEPAFQVIFGLAMNLSLLDGTVYPGGTGTIKSLSKSSAATIFSGAKAQWDAVPEFGNLENWVNGVGTPTDVHVCRRVAGSGTQAAAQVEFLRQECTAFARSFATAASWSVPGELEEISSSTKILSQCVDVNTRAIGISSLEKQPGAKYGTNWAYVAIDGIMPTEENAATGKYDYVFENSMQYYNDPNVVDAAQKGFIEALFAAAKDASVLAGKTGVLGVPDYVINTPGDFADLNANGILAEYNPANPVSWVTRDTQGCKPLVQVFP